MGISSGKQASRVRAPQREFTEEFRREAVQMMLDGLSAASVSERLGLSGTNLLYRWKRSNWNAPARLPLLSKGGSRELEIELHRVERRTRHPKKSVSHFQPTRVAHVYAAIDAIAQDERLPTATVCDVLDVSRSAYYAWRAHEPSRHQQRDDVLTPLVRAVFWKHRRRYGTRRIADELADLGEVCSPRRVAKILKTQGLRAIQPKSFVPRTTDSRHRLSSYGRLGRRSSALRVLSRMAARSQRLATVCQIGNAPLEFEARSGDLTWLSRFPSLSDRICRRPALRAR